MKTPFCKIQNNRIKAPIGPWEAVACTDDGTTVVAAEYGGGGGSMFISTNTGDSWTQLEAPIVNGWQGIACSTDGTTIIVSGNDYVTGHNTVYISEDTGETWVKAAPPAQPVWNAVACSADASNILLAGNTIFSLQEPGLPPPAVPSPTLNIGHTASAFNVSWLVPSTGFVLEETFDLANGNWTNAPSESTLYLTNLNYQWTAPPSQKNAFFRLRQQ